MSEIGGGSIVHTFESWNAMYSIKQPPLYLTIGEFVRISLDDGSIEYGHDYQPDEAARRFWHAMSDGYGGPMRERAEKAEGERDQLKARVDFLREMLALLSVSYVPTEQVLRWLDRPEPPSATLLAQPEFPLPIRPAGSHHYVSTYCVHGDHAACRLRCKKCAADCECGCGHPTAPSCRWPACLSEAEQQQLADDTGRAMHGEDTELMPDPRPGCGCVDRGIGDEGEAELAAAEAALRTRATGEDVPPAREMTEAETAEYLPRVTTEGIDTPGCDCRHEGMGVSWHRGNCVWRKGQP